ncbi:pre-rrna-processing protein tsr2 [Diaporthe amygdali]|uniref:pre-rrna-processing protein tsr2 n=1 Tax=Phomopsis amygdali TaxID=1214568 RepID=UPI0022FED622|nr:pre-rrna-processing protein tsr2 [Diaporthe amygdali]KAJ0119476.1 pre-rrna-processing protein tsr2 [Diaporthe amygdali]
MASSATTEASSDVRQSRFEQGVALSLNLWPALTLAVQNNWGGADSADKRDWFAGQVVEQFPPFTATATATNGTTTSQTQQQGAQPQEEPDAEYLEELMLQVMLDEFEVNVDDDTAYDVAAEIVRLRGQCARGSFDEVDRLLARWQARKGEKVHFKHGEDQDAETDWEDDDENEEDGSEDEDMEDAPALVETAAAPKKDKALPEVDEDGFTKVTRKR